MSFGKFKTDLLFFAIFFFFFFFEQSEAGWAEEII